MTEYENDLVNELFAASTSDLTPAFSRHAARVLYAPVSRDPEYSRRCASVLSESERRRANRIAAEENRGLFEQRRAFRRFCAAGALESSQPLSEIVFEETDNGRPFLPETPDIWLSFSSCSLGMLGAWSSTHAVGVDIEDQTRELDAAELAGRFFSIAEAEGVRAVVGAARHRRFFRLWTLKEAALKSIGEGLPFGLDIFEFELEPELRVVQAPAQCGGSARFNASLVEGTNGCAALVIRGIV